MLVGDSLGMVVLGCDTTLPVTLDAMVHHTAAVSRGAQRALVVADMPFLTFQVSVAEAVRNAGPPDAGRRRRGREDSKAAGRSSTLSGRLVDIGIPVMGHLGLLPQSVHQLGGYRQQATREEDAARLARGRSGARGRGRVRHRAGVHPGGGRPRGHRRAAHPHHRHRRGPALRRAGAGLLRHARALARRGPAVREEVRRARRIHRQGGRGLRRGRAGRAASPPRPRKEQK